MKKVTILTLALQKQNKIPLTMVTAYDYPTAFLVEKAGVDMVLVGDSLGMVVQGEENTLAVTVEEMIYHTKAVKKGLRRALLIVDMPFGSYKISVTEAVRNAHRVVKESGAEVVKLEGGQEIVETVQAIVQAGIPVMGHIGLRPQAINQMGGYKVQGKTREAAQKLLEDALALEKAGCCALVLEGMPDKVSEMITTQLQIPTIGIGAGVGCDGQVLVFHDLVGFGDGKCVPKFVKRYADIGNQVVEAVQNYCEEVRARQYPSADYTYTVKERED
ncbi:3-methyl-2-oxobutanoate hydroxymethyltransferase [bacterium]|jgi:3-methyl-2-oxobutanoate hydroxymethyltransferase|nr:3-methyl-2-oxobutanoate hydroxymethyltransferase [bacterium]MBT3581103.1 3-methyl-2-oxobutanoate hydroxymethyltransferase [bacterium]MBT4552564.1 3-methyl-2-oxobutanoate hydroxymethyltransferase [bacterium]MBT5988405.1 3-methyl-2-oxobutanoate hydroxymethyltransferase [bacterium]MBT7087928.1 3-methyl-2-oxobutanoate hydroxymethyltransferase [bacterium]